MNSLLAKLSVALVALVGLMGVAFYVVDRVNTRVYYEELSQHLNAPIAMYVTEQRQLIENGVADLDSLRDLASHAMVINPTAEIYLLDAEGDILGHNQPPDAVLGTRVDLAPITMLISGEAQPPVRGTDPRNVDSAKVFSAAEVRSEAGLEGYLYVVLGGQTYETLANNIGDTYTAKASAVAMASIVLLTVAIGLIVFRVLTRRLKRLNCEMQRLTEARFAVEPTLTRPADGGDEIDELGAAFLDMSSQIRRQIEQLKETDKIRRELVSNISHDLRTPLAAIQGYIETLIIKSESMSASDRGRFLRIARKHVVRLGVLVGDLFELSKLDSTSVTPKLERFSLPELIQDVSQEFAIESSKKDIDLEIEVSDASVFTVGDIGLIQRVLENLVRNAIRFTPEGGVVTLSIAEKPQTVAVAVSDNGPGIAEKDVPRIFDRFYRALDGEEARSDSSGLGLAIVKRILDLHDSRITVSSQLNVGTRFEFELPLIQQAA
ncbi:MAG: HAMP domain-containing sensor histidine kinase [Woeseiaceae bacterium]|nr:HAMP domain-containing sensor histidine kinase [Woeseiaceae bacterium]